MLASCYGYRVLIWSFVKLASSYDNSVRVFCLPSPTVMFHESSKLPEACFRGASAN